MIWIRVKQHIQKEIRWDSRSTSFLNEIGTVGNFQLNFVRRILMKTEKP